VSFGRPRRVGRGARYGAAAGLPVGALVGAGRKTPDCNCGISTQGLNTFAGAFTGAAYGAAAGALAGAFWRPERWERVPALAESAHVRLIARPGTVGVTLGGRF
jgi:hypothetical protein